MAVANYEFRLLETSTLEDASIYVLTRVKTTPTQGGNNIIFFNTNGTDNITNEVNIYFKVAGDDNTAPFRNQSIAYWRKKDVIGSSSKFDWRISESFAWSAGSNWKIFIQSGVSNPVVGELYMLKRLYRSDSTNPPGGGRPGVVTQKRIYKRRKEYGV